ncbi:MAG: hypothetical protein IJU68_02000 [Bacteroidales bacterium]|nr:hypothetical protein [Bacteroidales bacterium]
MKRLYILSLLIVLAACTTRPAQLRTGDLIFVGIPENYRIAGSMAEAISVSTNQDSLNIIHTAIADVRGDSVWIIDATIKHGVDRHPLDTFLNDFTLKDGSYPRFIVKRLKDNKDAERYVERARGYTGLGYNRCFVPCDTALYCTELVRDSYRRPDGSYIFSEAPMNFKAPDGTMPEYWTELFAILGMDVPQGIPGTNPRAMMEEECLKYVGPVSVLPQ